MSKFDLNERKFTALFNSRHGQVDHETVFSYFQKDNLVWATYMGGEIKIGTISGFFTDDNTLKLRYGHWDAGGVFRSGTCHSTLTHQSDNRIRIQESWIWDDESQKGESTLVEID